MKNKPTCLFCHGKLEATSVSISRGISSYDILGSNQPFAIPSQDEITLKINCPQCGAYGEALGDKASFSGNSKHPIIEIDNVAIGSLMNGSGIIEAFHPKLQPFNPSRRDNNPNRRESNE
jgi:hypothetical protein